MLYKISRVQVSEKELLDIPDNSYILSIEDRNVVCRPGNDYKIYTFIFLEEVKRKKRAS